MTVLSWFAFFRDAGPVAEAVLDEIAAGLRGVPGLRQGMVFSPPPTDTAHPFTDQEPAPAMVLQLQFDEIEALERAIAADGPVAALTTGAAQGRHVTQQAMVTRRYPVPDPTLRPQPGTMPCSYLVHYLGPAADLNAWNAHYNAHHPRIMAKFPGVRAIEIYTRIDWVSGLDWEHENAMQRNKLLFDSAGALSAGLSPEIMQEMRADFHRFPPFEGGNAHYAMATRFARIGHA